MFNLSFLPHGNLTDVRYFFEAASTESGRLVGVLIAILARWQQTGGAYTMKGQAPWLH